MSLVYFLLFIFNVYDKLLTLTVNKVKNGSHPSKYKGLGPFIFFA